MTQAQITQIQNNPKYQQLVKKRSRFAWTLTIIMLLIYYAFIMVIAFEPTLLGLKVGSSVITIGIPIGIAIIFISFILAGVYVWRANGEFDQLTKEVRASIGKVAS